MLSFSSPEEGFDLIRQAYVNSEITSGDFADALLDNNEFDPEISDLIKYQAIQLFREWDCPEEDEENWIYSKKNEYKTPDGNFLPKGVFVGWYDEYDEENVISQGLTKVEK